MIPGWDVWNISRANRQHPAAISKEAFKIIRSRYTVENHVTKLRGVLEQVMSQALATIDAGEGYRGAVSRSITIAIARP